MKLSKYFQIVELRDGIVAIYNSLLMDILYVEKNYATNIKNFNVSNKDKKILLNKGIYVKNEKQDIDALKIAKNRYNSFKGKVNIIYLIVTSSCNLACKYCFVENCTYNNKIEINMSVDTALTAIKKYGEYILNNNISDANLIFYGGEPLVNWEVMTSVIDYVKKEKLPIKISMVTNATLLTIDKIKYLAKNDVEIGVSIDGPKKLNDLNRVYRASSDSVYDKVISKFSMLEMEKCKYGLSITVSKEFLKYKEEVIEWLKKLNVKSIFYNLYHYTTYEDGWEKYYEEASEFLIYSYKELIQNGINDGRIIRKIESFFENEFKFSDCGAVGGNQLVIKPNGNVCVCHGYFKTNKYEIGNITRNSIKELISTPEFDFWKNRCTLNNAKCLNCEALFVCGGGCVIQSEALFGDRNHVDEPFCIHSKKTLKWILQKCYDDMNRDVIGGGKNETIEQKECC